VNNSLDRLFAGISATLREHVIPGIADSFARGQAVGIIDLLNNIAPRVEWARAPILEAVEAKIELLRVVGGLMPSLPKSDPTAALERLSSAALGAERARLDGAIGDALAWAHRLSSESDDASAREALGLLVKHAHDELTREMKITRKPLFAEIASGRDN
jgi:hypothetical protein